MTFDEAMHEACRELGYDSHIHEIQAKSELHTYAERIASGYVRFDKKNPLRVKNSYMYLDSVDFCFYQFGNEIDFAISGNIHGNDKLNIQTAIEKALKLCEVAEGYLKEEV